MESGLSSPSSSSPDLEVTDDDVFTEGDMTIISSDNLRFRLPSFYLLAASGVIRDMWDPQGGSPHPDIIFTDPDIERASAVSFWLKLATDGDLPPLSEFARKSRVQNLIELAHKYDCHRMGITITTILQQMLDANDILPLPVLLSAAARFGQPNLIAKVIRLDNRRYKATLPENGGSPDLSYITNGRQVDPSAWRWSSFRKVPHDQIWALLRTNALGGTPDQRADRYLSLMSQIKNTAGTKKRKADEADLSQS